MAGLLYYTKEENKMNEKVKAIIRLIVMAVLMVNMGLTVAGKNPIPLDETALTEWLTVAAAGISAVYSWWKNNNVTKQAQQAQAVLNELKTSKTEESEEQ